MGVGIICLAFIFAPFVAILLIDLIVPRNDVLLAMGLFAVMILLVRLPLVIVAYWKWRFCLPRAVRVEDQWLIVKWANQKELRLLFDECRWKEGTTKDDHMRWLLRRTPAIVLMFPVPGKITVGREPLGYARWVQFAERSLTRIDT